ncbi:hypothetical protein FOL47_004666 [Perkinsus chesapeaki]|uniref:Uncharacterized protein n=1 Tax=Perkinsus chesapeaki TaxID=330153 RepID=A0A7J6M160_PERCH|nr:hypothetical protein FOL47_004666 [Perkinsus chesapeaki]
MSLYVDRGEVPIDNGDFRAEMDKLDNEFISEMSRVAGAYLNRREELIEQQHNSRQYGRYEEVTVSTRQRRFYWLQCMLNHPVMKGLIRPADEDLLAYLTNIISRPLFDSQVGDGDNSRLGETGFELIFVFDDNPYFEETLLKKTYIMSIGQDVRPVEPLVYMGWTWPGLEISLLSITSSTVTWRPGRDVTMEYHSRRQKNKKTGETRMVMEAEPCGSFFTFFNTLTPSPEGELSEYEPCDLRALELAMQYDFRIATTIRDSLIPQVV